MAGPFSTIDVICARRQALIYVSPPFCEAEFSSTGEPVIVLNPIRRRRGPTGFVVIAGGRLRFKWDTVPGAICYSLYRREGGEYVLVAECFPCGDCNPAEPDTCCYECDACPAGCYVITAITEDGETEPSAEACTEGCDVTITTESPLPDGAFNAPYSFQLDQEVGQESTEQWSIIDGALPAGLTLSPSGLISGTPTEGGNFTFTTRVEAMCTESTGDSDEKPFLLNIAGGPEPTCILRLTEYDTVAQPIFVAPSDPVVPDSTDPEWDGVWNYHHTPVLPDEEYYYRGSNNVFFQNPGAGPNISVGGKVVSTIQIRKVDVNTWELRILYFVPSDIPRRTWTGYKIGGDTSSPVGVYLIGTPAQGFPPGSFSDNRPSVEVEICP